MHRVSLEFRLFCHSSNPRNSKSHFLDKRRVFPETQKMRRHVIRCRPGSGSNQLGWKCRKQNRAVYKNPSLSLLLCSHLLLILFHAFPFSLSKNSSHKHSVSSLAMYNSEKTVKDRRNKHEKQNPSFSSTLLDKIYRSIDESEPKVDDFKFRRDTPAEKKQSKSLAAEEEEEHILSLRQACLLDKWMEQNAKEKISLRQRHHFWSELDKKASILDHDYDRHDALFFSSGSNSSESSSGGLSSSDTESFYNPKPSKSCFSSLKPIRVGSEKPDRRATTLLYEQRELHVIDDYRFNSGDPDRETQKSKSRLLKMYGNLKQPISPGGKLSSFLNSIFAGNGKKSKNQTFTDDLRKQRVSRSAQPSTCSSASSFSRSCLSKNSPASREKLRNLDKRSVRFCSVNLVPDEDLRQRKNLEKQDLKPMSVSVPATEKSQAARDFLKQYHQKQSKPSVCDRDEENKHQDHDDDDDDDDDDVSCASSDLFELDHLAVVGDRYREELPVYETTRVDRNRAISNCKSNPK